MKAQIYVLNVSKKNMENGVNPFQMKIKRK